MMKLRQNQILQQQGSMRQSIQRNSLQRGSTVNSASSWSRAHSAGSTSSAASVASRNSSVVSNTNRATTVQAQVVQAVTVLKPQQQVSNTSNNSNLEKQKSSNSASSNLSSGSSGDLNHNNGTTGPNTSTNNTPRLGPQQNQNQIDSSNTSTANGGVSSVPQSQSTTPVFSYQQIPPSRVQEIERLTPKYPSQIDPRSARALEKMLDKLDSNTTMGYNSNYNWVKDFIRKRLDGENAVSSENIQGYGPVDTDKEEYEEDSEEYGEEDGNQKQAVTKNANGVTISNTAEAGPGQDLKKDDIEIEDSQPSSVQNLNQDSDNRKVQSEQQQQQVTVDSHTVQSVTQVSVESSVAIPTPTDSDESVDSHFQQSADNDADAEDNDINMDISDGDIEVDEGDIEVDTPIEKNGKADNLPNAQPAETVAGDLNENTVINGTANVNIETQDSNTNTVQTDANVNPDSTTTVGTQSKKKRIPIVVDIPLEYALSFLPEFRELGMPRSLSISDLCENRQLEFSKYQNIDFEGCKKIMKEVSRLAVHGESYLESLCNIHALFRADGSANSVANPFKANYNNLNNSNSNSSQYQQQYQQSSQNQIGSSFNILHYKDSATQKSAKITELDVTSAVVRGVIGRSLGWNTGENVLNSFTLPCALARTVELTEYLRQVMRPRESRKPICEDITKIDDYNPDRSYLAVFSRPACHHVPSWTVRCDLCQQPCVFEQLSVGAESEGDNGTVLCCIAGCQNVFHKTCVEASKLADQDAYSNRTWVCFEHAHVPMSAFDRAMLKQGQLRREAPNVIEDLHSYGSGPIRDRLKLIQNPESGLTKRQEILLLGDNKSPEQILRSGGSNGHPSLNFDQDDMMNVKEVNRQRVKKLNNVNNVSSIGSKSNCNGQEDAVQHNQNGTGVTESLKDKDSDDVASDFTISNSDDEEFADDSTVSDSEDFDDLKELKLIDKNKKMVIVKIEDMEKVQKLNNADLNSSTNDKMSKSSPGNFSLSDSVAASSSDHSAFKALKRIKIDDDSTTNTATNITSKVQSPIASNGERSPLQPDHGPKLLLDSVSKQTNKTSSKSLRSPKNQYTHIIFDPELEERESAQETDYSDIDQIIQNKKKLFKQKENLSQDVRMQEESEGLQNGVALASSSEISDSGAPSVSSGVTTGSKKRPAAKSTAALKNRKNNIIKKTVTQTAQQLEKEKDMELRQVKAQAVKFKRTFCIERGPHIPETDAWANTLLPESVQHIGNDSNNGPGGPGGPNSSYGQYGSNNQNGYGIDNEYTGGDRGPNNPNNNSNMNVLKKRPASRRLQLAAAQAQQQNIQIDQYNGTGGGSPDNDTNDEPMTQQRRGAKDTSNNNLNDNNVSGNASNLNGNSAVGDSSDVNMDQNKVSSNNQIVAGQQDASNASNNLNGNTNHHQNLNLPSDSNSNAAHSSHNNNQRCVRLHDKRILFPPPPKMRFKDQKIGGIWRNEDDEVACGFSFINATAVGVRAIQEEFGHWVRIDTTSGKSRDTVTDLSDLPSYKECLDELEEKERNSSSSGSNASLNGSTVGSVVNGPSGTNTDHHLNSTNGKKKNVPLNSTSLTPSELRPHRIKYLLDKKCREIWGVRWVKPKIVILDIDVHHGNGTQSVFYDDPTVLFISLHRAQLLCERFAGSDYTGMGEGAGFNINLPLLHRDGDHTALAYLKFIVEPIISQFSPELIIISLGYDALDVSREYSRSPFQAPGCDCCFSPQVFGHIVRSMQELCKRVVLHSEGGYDPLQCGLASQHVLKSLLGVEELESWRQTPGKPGNLARRLHNFMKIFGRWWKFPKG